MARVDISIEIDNEAFQDVPGEELSRVIAEVAYRIKRKATNTPAWELFDVNGNSVGYIITTAITTD